MKYLILIYGNEQSRAIWSGFSAAEQQAGYELYGRIHDELVASGELVVAEALADSSMGRRVTATPTATGSAVTVMDGPFPEVKELVNGLYLVECTADRAVEIAAMFPESQFGLIEIRPVMTLSSPDAG